VKEQLLSLARRLREVVLPHLRQPNRKVARQAGGGDPHFAVDEIAEEAVRAALAEWSLPIAYFSEDRGLVRLAERPEHLLIIDPIDGTRPAMGCMESACFSVGVVPYSERPRWKDMTHALICELMSGDCFYADAATPGVDCSGPRGAQLSANTDLSSMFWSIELTAHPVRRLTEVYGHMIDGSVTRGAVFVFTSSSYSLTRIVTGQLDAHVDIGHRILKDRPDLAPEFLRVGQGKLVTLFPYDIAPGAFLAEKAGAVVTDAYGRPLDDLHLLTDKSIDGQCSIIAAANAELHGRIMKGLGWDNLGHPLNDAKGLA
jgi:myo-inositol-1(or 4)-monophosphatase